MDGLDTREWLLTNGLGSFASGTVCDARTRTYHGWLVAALTPPTERTLLLSHLDASLEIRGQVYSLGTNFWRNEIVMPRGYQLLQSFQTTPVPTWVWGQEDWQLSRRLVMPYGVESPHLPRQRLEERVAEGEASPLQYGHRLLIQYQYTGQEPVVLCLRPMIGDRNFHHQQRAEPSLQFHQKLEQRRILLQAMRSEILGTPWQLSWTQGQYQSDGVWYWNYWYPQETQRGLGDAEDLYSPGYLRADLQPGDRLTLEARVGWSEPEEPCLEEEVFDAAIAAEQKRVQVGLASGISSPRCPLNHPQIADPFWQKLLQAGDQFIVYRSSIQGPTVIAGYPWFNDWGRDTLIALPGLALTPCRFDLAKGLLQTFSQFCRHGLIPNNFPDEGTEPSYNSLDATLWWIETLGLYLTATEDWEFLLQQYPIAQKIYKAFTTGTLYNIHVDATDGLLAWDAPHTALTWMDVVLDGQPITPRRGKPVEINALWYSALCWLSRWAKQLDKMGVDQAGNLGNQMRRYCQHAQQVKGSLQKFWNPERAYFYDTIQPNDSPDPAIRPNAVIALSLHHCGFPEHQARQVLQIARDRLLTPYGLRSLDPDDPDYRGYYAGDRFHRDRAYHQGTVWSWLIGPFIRAWERFYDPTEAPLPFDWQPLQEHFLSEACLGSISEIFDGDPPHQPQGAIAQAWSVAEMIRHFPKH